MRWSMAGRLTTCVLLSYRTLAESIADLVPAGLSPFTFGPWAFWSIVVCRVSGMRPVLSPRWMGIDYTHVAYRLYVRARTAAGPVDGLYFVRSDADHPLVCRIGRRATDFGFHQALVSLTENGDGIQASVAQTPGGHGDACLSAGPGDPVLATGSCFPTYEHARRFLKYRPRALAVDHAAGQVRVARVIRDETAWRESPLNLTEAHWTLFDRLGQHETHLELATRVAPVDYRWRLGERLALANGHALART